MEGIELRSGFVLCKTLPVSNLVNIVYQLAGKCSFAQNKCQHQFYHLMNANGIVPVSKLQTVTLQLAQPTLSVVYMEYLTTPMGVSRYKCRYVGTDGIYTHTAAYEQDPHCSICSPGIPFEVQSSMTLQQVTVTTSDSDILH